MRGNPSPKSTHVDQINVRKLMVVYVPQMREDLQLSHLVQEIIVSNLKGVPFVST